MVRGDGLYYYIDDASERTRYLYLDTATSDSEIYYNTKQQEWLKQTLLTVPEEWHVVVTAHIWRDVDYSVTPPVDNGFSLSGKWCLDLFDAFNSRTGEFGACSGQVEFCVGGHTHVDGDFTSDGGIPVIITETDSAIVRSGLGFTQDTITEASVSAVVANYAARKVDVIRIGRGSSRTVTLPAAHLEGATGYTNVLKDANIGWQENMRYSSSGGTDQSADGWDITGYIPAVPYDVVRLKNVTWKYATYEENGGRGGITMFGSGKAYIGKADSIDATAVSDFNVVLDDDGNIVQFTVPKWDEGTAYIRICCQDINENSIITVNEEIVGTDASAEVATKGYVDDAIRAYVDEAILGGAW